MRKIRRLRRKRKQTDPEHRRPEFNQRTKRRKTGEENRTAEVQRKAVRRKDGDIEREDEYKGRSRKRRAGDEPRNRSADIRSKAGRREEGDIDRKEEYKRRSQKRRTRNFPAHTFWTADVLPTDEQLKHFEKDPSTAVAAFRLMAGIPSDPRIKSANLKFEVNKDEIISRFSDFCGHRASIKICGACRVGDVMAAGESYQLPLTHIGLLSSSIVKAITTISTDKTKFNVPGKA